MVQVLPLAPPGAQTQSGWLCAGVEAGVHGHGLGDHHAGGGHDAGVGVVDGEADGIAQAGQRDVALLAHGDVRRASRQKSQAPATYWRLPTLSVTRRSIL